jgi:hypothetical protein
MEGEAADCGALQESIVFLDYFQTWKIPQNREGIGRSISRAPRGS